MSEPIIEIVKDVIVAVKGIEPSKVVPEANLIDDLGADSLDAIENVMALETHYNKELAEENIEGIETVADIIALVESIVG